jgi:invasion protein IalB
MRFLLIFLIVIVLFAAAIAVFVVPPDQWQSVVSRFQSEWTPQLAIGDNDTAASAAQLTGTSAPDHQAIREAAGIPLGDWLYDCDDGGDDRDRPCVIAHQIADRENGRIVFSWLIGANVDGRFQAVWQTPTGVLVNRGVVLDAGTEKPIVLPYTACVAGFCEAVANLAPDFIDTLLNTQEASATVYTVSGQALTFPVSVDGLADGIIALKNRSRQR